ARRLRAGARRLRHGAEPLARRRRALQGGLRGRAAPLPDDPDRNARLVGACAPGAFALARRPARGALMAADARALRGVLHRLRAAARAASPREWLERVALWKTWRLERPVVFVLGLPRSGTTLVSQYLAHRFEVAYWTNGVGRHPRAPLVTTWLDR